MAADAEGSASAFADALDPAFKTDELTETVLVGVVQVACPFACGSDVASSLRHLLGFNRG